MLELALNARRGSFHLEVECRLTSDWTVIFGHSGAGKSTLLRLLAGLDRNARGETAQGRVTLDGSILTDTARGVWSRPGRRRTSLVAQQPSLFPHLSVEANVAYGLAGLDRVIRANRVAEMLELVDATDLVSRRPQDLSGGQAQRVAMARALAPGPSLLLLDEPFSALDGTASDALVDRLQVWLRANGVQTVLATHDATDAFSTGAEVALLREGRLVAVGPAAEVLLDERERIAHRLMTP
ncbi:MAG TPA: ATP-binding cassette domain-containing protein [Terracidiphilus sp.]|nr:ATP-binding cassette domain-containing protein [Terracidiphilus sp.]